MSIEDNSPDNQPASAVQTARRLGAMAESGRIVGDIVSPASDENDWNVLCQNQAEDRNP